MSGFWEEKTVKARKRHECDECGRPIYIGVHYTRGAGINVEGDFSVWVAHTECLAASREIMRLGDCPSDEYWELEEQVRDMDGTALAWLMMFHPVVYERFRPELEEQERFPDPYTWSGLHVSPRRMNPYVWHSVG